MTKENSSSGRTADNHINVLGVSLKLSRLNDKFKAVCDTIFPSSQGALGRYVAGIDCMGNEHPVEDSVSMIQVRKRIVNVFVCRIYPDKCRVRHRFSILERNRFTVKTRTYASEK